MMDFCFLLFYGLNPLQVTQEKEKSPVDQGFAGCVNIYLLECRIEWCWPGSEKNVRPQCNATFMATVQSSTIVDIWYSIFLSMVFGSLDMSCFEKKNEVRNNSN